MKQKTLFVLSLIMLFLLVFPVAAQDTVTISYAIWDNNQLPAHEQIIEAFEAENPGIDVEIQVVPWANYWDRLQTTLAGGDAYDVFWMNGPNFPVYASRGVLMNLQSRVDDEEIDLSSYPEALVNLYSYDGEVYGLPKDFDTIGLYYNKDLFDAAGLEYPDDTWTWDDLRAAAETLTADGVWGFAATTEDQTGYWNFIYQNDGQVIEPDGSAVLIDEPASCEALTYLYGYVADGLSPDGATQASASPALQLFPGGAVAMITAGSWMARTYADSEPNIDVAPLPTGPDGTRATIIHGLANVAWADTAHPEEAALLVEFLGSEAAANILAQSGTVIPAYNGYQEAWVESIPDMNLQVLLDATEYSIPYPTAAQGMAWNTEIATVLGEVWAGNTPIDDACASAAAAANEVLAAEE